MEIIQQAKSLKILVVGDSCTDRFVYGTCERLSPEAPVPILKHSYTKEMPGMAANVMENIRAFTSSVDIITQTNNIVKTRYIDEKSNQHILRFDSGSYMQTGDKLTSQALTIICDSYDYLLISDYAKGFLCKDELKIFTLQNIIKTYVDTKKEDISCYENSIIKLNEFEAQSAKSTLQKSSTLITTLGSKGAKYMNKIIPTKNVEVFDVSGAGDTFLATFSIFHYLTNNFEESIIFANKCATIAIQRSGTYAIRKSDIT